MDSPIKYATHFTRIGFEFSILSFGELKKMFSFSLANQRLVSRRQSIHHVVPLQTLYTLLGPAIPRHTSADYPVRMPVTQKYYQGTEEDTPNIYISFSDDYMSQSWMSDPRTEEGAAKADDTKVHRHI